MHSFFLNRQQGAKGFATVLVVDADVKAVRSLASALREEGYAVLEATSFEEGKRLWTSRTPDVLVVDIRLGQFNGLQLLMRARSDRPDLRAIITCPFADVVLEAETRRYGGIFLIKPVEPWQVVEAVRNVPAQTGAVPAPVTPPLLLERRRVERRQMEAAGFAPDRRLADRRLPVPEVDDGRSNDQRRLIPGFAPDIVTQKNGIKLTMQLQREKYRLHKVGDKWRLLPP